MLEALPTGSALVQDHFVHAPVADRRRGGHRERELQERGVLNTKNLPGSQGACQVLAASQV